MKDGRRPPFFDIKYTDRYNKNTDETDNIDDHGDSSRHHGIDRYFDR